MMLFTFFRFYRFSYRWELFCFNYWRILHLKMLVRSDDSRPLFCQLENQIHQSANWNTNQHSASNNLFHVCLCISHISFGAPKIFLTELKYFLKWKMRLFRFGWTNCWCSIRYVKWKNMCRLYIRITLTAMTVSLILVQKFWRNYLSLIHVHLIWIKNLVY